MFQTNLLINGDLVAGEGPEEAVVDPATGRTITRIQEASPHQVERAVTAAATAFKVWGQTTPQERSLLLLRVADRLEADASAYADLESLNCGKPHARVLPDELPAVVDCFRFFAGAARVLGGSA